MIEAVMFIGPLAGALFLYLGFRIAYTLGQIQQSNEQILKELQFARKEREIGSP